MQILTHSCTQTLGIDYSPLRSFQRLVDTALERDEETRLSNIVSMSAVASGCCAIVNLQDLVLDPFPDAGFYHRHSDAQNSSRRVLTAVYYANPEWTPADGGQLRLWLPSGQGGEHSPTTCYLLLATCYLLLAACYLLLAACCLLLAACYWLLATGYWLLAACYFLLSTFYFLLAASYLLLATCYLLPATCYLLPATCYLLTCCWLLAACYWLSGRHLILAGSSSLLHADHSPLCGFGMLIDTALENS